jgi:hypothetical protein
MGLLVSRKAYSMAIQLEDRATRFDRQRQDELLHHLVGRIEIDVLHDSSRAFHTDG